MTPARSIFLQLQIILLCLTSLAQAQSGPPLPKVTRQVPHDIAELCGAAYRGDVAKIDRLIADGAPVNGVDATGQQPLMNAIRGGNIKAVKLLLKHGADPNIRSRSTTGSSALCFAASEGRLSIVQAMMAAGAKPNLRGRSGATPLGIAAINGHLDIAKYLLSKGADPNGWSSYTRSGTGLKQFRLQSNTLCSAIMGKNADVVALLLKKGARTDVEGEDGHPLSLASANGELKLMALLLSAGADINAEGSEVSRNSAGHLSPLLAAIKFKQTNAVRLLIGTGADLTSTFQTFRYQKVTPLQFAEQAGHQQAVAMISSALAKQ